MTATLRSPRVVTTAAQLRDLSGRVALVPTMGALHDGHESLMRHARPLADTLVVSIFVNPTQFAAGEDFTTYPRTLDDDLARCAAAGVDVVFVPEVDQMYPTGFGDDLVTVDPGPLGAVLEGAVRPTHFRGVLTVVAKLFGLVRPQIAVFGEKDYQQLALIRQMSDTLCLGVEVIGCPTVREPDGLAMSSRNRYLDADDRRRAAVIPLALAAGVAAAADGQAAVVAAVTDCLATEGVVPDYVAVAAPDLGPAVPGPARLLVAARVGTPRLLDNTDLVLGSTPGAIPNPSQGA